MKYHFILIILLFITINTYSQKGYYLVDSNAYYGVEIVDKGLSRNAEYCHLKENGEIIQLSPEKVKEYGLSDGRVYVSKTLPGSDPEKKCFFERLVDDSLKLYKFKSRNGKIFYLQDAENSLIPLVKTSAFDNGYKQELEKYKKECPEMEEIIKHINYNSRTLTAFTKQYNNCQKEYIPLFTLSAFAALEFARYKAQPYENDLSKLTYNYHRSLNYGVGMDIPLMFDKAFFSTGFIYGKSSYNTSSVENDRTLALVIEKETLRVPFIFKLTSHSLNFRTYVLLGVNYKYLLYNNSLLLKVTETPNRESFDNTFFDVSEISIIYDEVLKKHTSEVVSGVGIARQLSIKRSLFLELKYQHEMDLSKSDHLNMRGFSVVTGINF